jgi:hypothetical protein
LQIPVQLPDGSWITKRFDAESWHEMMKELFLEPREIDLPDGRQVRRPASSRIQDRADFADYVTEVELHLFEKYNLWLDEKAEA